MKLSELTAKDVICDIDGSRLGKVSDLEINESDGKIKSIFVMKGPRILSSFQKERIEISWSKINKVGSDVIIVNENYLKTKTKEQKS